MDQAASVRSIDAVRDFRAAMLEFSEEVRSAMVDVDLETRRGLEWVLGDQPAYWKHEARRASDAITQAKVELHRARMKTLPGGGTPSCMDERKAVERAERRLRHAEEKIEIVREWGRVGQQEVTEYSGRAAQLATVIDSTVPRAIAFLDHAISRLESYVAVAHAPAAATMAKPTSNEEKPAPANQKAAAKQSSAQTDDVELDAPSNNPVAESS